MTRRLLSRRDAAEYLAMSERRLDEITKAGELAAKRDNRSVKYDIEELDRWADSLPSYEPRAAS